MLLLPWDNVWIDIRDSVKIQGENAELDDN